MKFGAWGAGIGIVVGVALATVGTEFIERDGLDKILGYVFFAGGNMLAAFCGALVVSGRSSRENLVPIATQIDTIVRHLNRAAREDSSAAFQQYGVHPRVHQAYESLLAVARQLEKATGRNIVDEAKEEDQLKKFLHGLLEDVDDVEAATILASVRDAVSEGADFSYAPTTSAPTGGVLKNVKDQRTSNSQDLIAGELTIQTGRDSYAFTASGHLNGLVGEQPEDYTKLAELAAHPANFPKSFVALPGLTKQDDFHIHLKSYEYGKALPAGEYRVRYEFRKKR